MNRFKALATYLFMAAWLITGCSKPQPDLLQYTGRYEKAVKERTHYVDVVEGDGELIVTASWDKYKKPLGYLNNDNFIVKGLGWAIKFTRGHNKQVNGFIMTGDAQWQKVNRDSSIYQSKKWQVFTDSAKLHTYPVPANLLRSVAGKYGDKNLFIQGDHLFLAASNGAKAQLYPISNNLFVADEYTLKITRTEQMDADKIELHYQNGYMETLVRVK